MMHDFAITENYAVFFDGPLVFKPELLLTGKVPFVFDKTIRARYAGCFSELSFLGQGIRVWPAVTVWKLGNMR